MAPPEGLTSLRDGFALPRRAEYLAEDRPLTWVKPARSRAAGRLGRRGSPRRFNRGVFRCRLRGTYHGDKPTAVPPGRQRRARSSTGWFLRGRPAPGCSRQPDCPICRRYDGTASEPASSARWPLMELMPQDRSRTGLPAGDPARLSGLGLHGWPSGADDDVGDVGRLGLAQPSALLPDQRLFLQISGRHPVRPGLSGLRTLRDRSPRSSGDLTFVEAWHDSMRVGSKRLEARRRAVDARRDGAGQYVGGRSRAGCVGGRDHRIGPSGGGGPGRSVLADGERQGVVRSGFGHLSFSKFYLNKKCVGSCVFAGSTHFFVEIKLIFV